MMYVAGPPTNMSHILISYARIHDTSSIDQGKESFNLRELRTIQFTYLSTNTIG